MSPIIVSVLIVSGVIGGVVVVAIVAAVVVIARCALGRCAPADVPAVVAALAGLVRAFCGLRPSAPMMDPLSAPPVGGATGALPPPDDSPGGAQTSVPADGGR